jgi:hypothetical protein
VNSQKGFLFMVLPALHISAMGMPQKEVYENRISRLEKE